MPPRCQVWERKAAGAVEILMAYEHGEAKVKSQQEAMFATAEAGDTILPWKFLGLPEAPSSFVVSLTPFGRSACGW